MAGVPPEWKLFVTRISLPLFHLHLTLEVPCDEEEDEEVEMPGRQEIEPGSTNEVPTPRKKRKTVTTDLIKLSLAGFDFSMTERPFDRSNIFFPLSFSSVFFFFLFLSWFLCLSFSVRVIKVSLQAIELEDCLNRQSPLLRNILSCQDSVTLVGCLFGYLDRWTCFLIYMHALAFQDDQDFLRIECHQRDDLPPV